MSEPQTNTVKPLSLAWYFLGLLLLFAAGFYLEKNSLKTIYTGKDVRNFEKVLHEKEALLESILLNTGALADSFATDSEFYSGISKEYFRFYQRYGISMYIYLDNELEVWTDNVIPVPMDLRLFPEENAVSLGNSVFYSRKYTSNSLTIVGLILIKTENPYENRFIQNGFQKDFRLDPEVEIVFTQEEGLFQVKDLKNEFLFSLDFENSRKEVPLIMALSLGCYIAFFLLLLILLRSVVHKRSANNKNFSVITSSLLIIVLIKGLSIIRFPSIIFDLDLFSPVKFSGSYFFSSIGNLFAAIFVLFFISYNFYVDYRFSYNRLKTSKTRKILLILLFLVISLFFFVLDNYVMKSLILDSNISFETYKVLDLSFFTFLGFLMLALLYVAYTLITDKLLVVFSSLGLRSLAITFLFLQIATFAFLTIFPVIPYFNSVSLLLFTLTSLLLFYFRFFGPSQYRFSNFVIFVMLFSIFTVIEVTRYSDMRHKSEMKRLAVSLSAEHDPIAELLLVEISNKIEEDEEIGSIITSPYFEFDYLYSTIERKYFSGFWDKYDMQITLCQPYDSVYVSPPDDSWYPCYSFFYDGLLSDGVQVPGTDFYYLDNLNGRISYFFFLRYNESQSDEITLFIELDSRLFAEGLGYPGLLLEDSYNRPPESYSYAKYNRGKLITSTGDFAYSTGSDVFASEKEGFEFLQFDEQDHIVYHLDADNIIIVSKPSLFWVDLLISFSYVFSFYFVVLLLLLGTSRISPISLKLRFNFKNKIQFTITAVLLVSFILFGAGTVYFSIQQYKDRQVEILKEKVQSVYIELIHKLEFETNLRGWQSESYYNLDELLQKFSNVFYTDINLFDADGQLLATSRNEVYNTGLVSRRMNAGAYWEMKVNKRSEFIHREQIGNLKYLSVYVPFINANNQMLAYLNLPYFTRQDELTREIANLVVAIINIVMLLSLLSFTIAVFVSNKVTSPLRMLQQKIARISLSEKNEKIEYSGRDEIASLVKEYNQMVDQLQESAELLAKSEREFAWREMAKQIAHEIKNPLTPMKLSVQHLQKAYLEKGENMDEKVDKITKMLIEQIDDLSAIATEFSSFAKMPQAKNEKLHLAKKLKNAIDLFTDYERCSVSLKVNTPEDIYVYADREQLSRVFINLIKNAIQSVPENRTGKVEIVLERKEDVALISIKDNGKGITEDIRERMFQPNFTTKSSGMGLGLSIVQNILNTAGGRIYYETEVNEGSVFTIELPVFEDNKKIEES